MSKFYKRFQKVIKKNLESCLAIGIDLDDFDLITESFKSVFVIDNFNPYKGSKNIVPIKDLYFLHNIGNIDVIFINQRYDDAVLQYIPLLTKRCSPNILLNEKVLLSNEYIKLFQRIRYEMLETENGYQIWKVIRK